MVTSSGSTEGQFTGIAKTLRSQYDAMDDPSWESRVSSATPAAGGLAALEPQLRPQLRHSPGRERAHRERKPALPDLQRRDAAGELSLGRAVNLVSFTSKFTSIFTDITDCTSIITS